MQEGGQACVLIDVVQIIVSDIHHDDGVIITDCVTSCQLVNDISTLFIG